ncbi:MAG: PhnD/SsuA/transferrin family substrate-binding protein [Acidimicrobiales bacterium]
MAHTVDWLTHVRPTKDHYETTTFRTHVALLAALAIGAASCGSDSSPTDEAAASDAVFTIGAIPDQDPDVLQRTCSDLSTYLTEALGVTVRPAPVTDYAASVSAFRTGDLDAVWFLADSPRPGKRARLREHRPSPSATSIPISRCLHRG